MRSPKITGVKSLGGGGRHVTYPGLNLWYLNRGKKLRYRNREKNFTFIYLKK